MTFDLLFAERLAHQIAAALTPFCDQIEVAGSIRRRRPLVGDIDLVVLPKPGQLEALKERCKRNTKVLTDGDQNLIVELKTTGDEPVQLDIFIAKPEVREMFETTPTNFGSLLLCRTGSVAHNIYLVQHAKALGLVWNPYHGVFGPDGTGRSKLRASATEAEIFSALKLPFVKPEDRER
jgi:DNA polymerase/3'-5' exonuclease PolX